MEICKLSIEDVQRYREEIINMLKQSFEKSFPEISFDFSSFNNRFESLTSYISEEKALVYGAKNGENLAGFVWFFEKDTPNGKLIHINHFVVDECFRRLGAGSALWNKVESFASKRGIEEIELLVTKNNEDAVNFYLNRNFEVERLVMKKRVLK